MRRQSFLGLRGVALAACAVLCRLAIASILAAEPIPAGLEASPSFLQDQEILTNDSIIQMVQAHLGTDVIVKQIQSSKCSFTLSTANLVKLKQAGVPDQVISAMQASSHGAAPSSSGSSSAKTAVSLAGGREYTIAEFSRMLPGTLSKAAVAHGLGPHDYEKEEAYIKKTLETCVLDTTNLKSVRPNPNDPAFEICQRNTAAHLTIDGMKDISVAAGNGHNPNSPKALGRGDLLMSTGSTGRWWPGEKYEITLKVFMDWGPAGQGHLPEFRFADVLSGAGIKGVPYVPGSAPLNASAAGAGATPAANASAGQKMPSGAYPVIDPATGQELAAQSYQLALLYLRNSPSVLSDPAVLKAFVQLATCGDGKTLTRMQNEFEGAQISAFYRDNAPAILANVPSTIKVGIQVALDQYNFSSSSFPIIARGLPQMRTGLHQNARSGAMQGLSMDYADFAARNVRVAHCITSMPLDFSLPQINQAPIIYELAFNPVALDRIPMDQATAREYIDQHPGRGASVVLSLEISRDATKFFQESTYPVVVFSSRVTGISIYDSYPNGKEIATIDLSKVTAGGADTSAGPSAGVSGAQLAGGGPNAQSTAGAPAAPTNGSSPDNAALPVPTVHDGVAGKVFTQFLEKCTAGDSKGCEMVGFNLEKGFGVDKDPQAAKAYYAKACSMGRKGDCGR